MPEWEGLSLNPHLPRGLRRGCLSVASLELRQLQGTNFKEEMAATLTHLFLLPVLLLPWPAETVSLLSSFKCFLLYLPFFLLSALHLALCPTISGAEGGKKEKQKTKTQGQKVSRSPGERCYFMIQCLFVLLRAGFRDLMEIRHVSPCQLCSLTSVFLVYVRWWGHDYYITLSKLKGDFSSCSPCRKAYMKHSREMMLLRHQKLSHAAPYA